MTAPTAALHPPSPVPIAVEGMLLSETLKAEIDRWVSQYPPGRQQSALLPSLLAAQRQHQGWLPRPLINAVADYLQIPHIKAYEVATFYTMFELKPVGQHKISICTNISCMLSGCDRIVQHLKKRLKINFGETTPDGKFTLKEVECLGACVNPPVMILDEQYHEQLTPAKIDCLLGIKAQTISDD